MIRPIGMLAMGLVLLSGCTSSGAGFETLDVHEWKAAYEATPDAFLLDVRTPEEFEQFHLENATLIPHDEIRVRADELPDKDTPIFVYCRTGNRSGMASETLAEMGYNVTNMGGGINDWLAAGYPVV